MKWIGAHVGQAMVRVHVGQARLRCMLRVREASDLVQSRASLGLTIERSLKARCREPNKQGR